MKRSRTPLLLAGLVAALVLGVGLGATAYSTVAGGTTTVVREVPTSSRVPTATTEGLAIGEIYEQTHKGVVEITAGGGPARAQGSGFAYDDAGHVVTNQHVVEGASSLSVRFWDGSTHSARLVGTDPSTDLAVIEVDAPQALLEPLRLGDSADVLVGDLVVAMGSPFGLEGTVTSGIVSALHRQMTAPNNFTITDSIQTDAAINHGNSGGPLLDGQGRVIGVNAQIESESGGNDGVGFAIPSDTVRSIVTQLIESGEVEHAYLGITMLPVEGGVAVTEVKPGTPAADAGLRPATGTSTVDGQQIPTGGDVIVAFDGDDVSSSAALQSAVDAKQPGDKVSITVLRGGERTTLQVTLGSRPS
ncbi:MAG TPA: trypsin-like peptidase domain-containing protein [Gaiellaceae bacterium]|nr:trypsin-like peptidase domain-containing protein [Gaiellaceae bacterium]